MNPLRRLFELRRPSQTPAVGGPPNLEDLLVPADANVRCAIERIDATDARIALVVEHDRNLIGTVTDGDVRRGLLAGKDLGSQVQEVMNARPITGEETISLEEASELMQAAGVRQLPIVDRSGSVMAVRLLDSANPFSAVADPVLVMAGGAGRRLGSITKHIPKPLVKVGGRPILETLVRDLASQGFTSITLAVNHRADLIERHFRDGSRFGVTIDYIREPTPLGTAGALRIFAGRCRRRFLVTNADLLTRVDFRALLDFHAAERHDLTIGLIEWTTELQYGLVETAGTRVTALREKPVLRHFVNAGIYVVEPTVADQIPLGVRSDMDEVITWCLEKRRIVGGFPIYESWADIGRPEDLRRALATFSERSDAAQ